MKPRHTLLAALALAVALPALLSLVTGCQESPPEPVFDNPFDPGSETGGDALNLRAFYLGGTVSVLWDHVEGHNISVYDVDRSLEDQSSWEPMVFDLPAPTASWIDSTAVPNVLHYYRVQAKSSDGTFTLASYIVPASVVTPPYIVPDPPEQEQPGRFLDLRVAAGEGDSLRVAGNASFTDADTHLAGAVGETLTVVWDLGPQAANGDSMEVYAQTFGDGYLSETASLDLLVGFAPPFTAEGLSEAGTIAVLNATLLIPDKGVVTMRFADTQAGLDAATPVPGAPTHPWTLLDVVAPQTVWGRFDGDFGFSSDVELVLLPDQLTDATFELELPDNGVISVPEVTVLNDAIATHMRYSETSTFDGIAWQPYAATHILPFTPAPGQVVIRGQFLNDYGDTQGRVIADTLEYVLSPLSIVFHTPTPDEILAGGEEITVSGRAVVADGGDLTNVQLDLADGRGFTVFPGTAEYWSYDWDVPTFRADTLLVLRARAWAGADSVTTSVTVTVTQLAVAITEPLEGEMLNQDSAVTIAGTATPPRDGAVDSVTVTVDGVPQDVSGITDWSVNGWSTPAVSVSTPVTITAAAWADGDSVRSTVNVTVEPSRR